MKYINKNRNINMIINLYKNLIENIGKIIKKFKTITEHLISY
jgi:hypothetical protein